MAREFDRNIFVMLLSIMIGAVIITAFVADLMSRSGWEVEKEGLVTQIKTIKGESENFTSLFMKSNIVLNLAREDRALGNYHFDLAFLWYNSALSERNGTLMDLYKTRGIENCTLALPNYIYSHDNFLEAKYYFNETKSHTTYERYLTILDLYVGLTNSGSNLALLRYDASRYLMYLTENLTFDAENNTVTYLTNVSELMGLFNETMGLYEEGLDEYEDIQDDIDGYEFFDEIR